MNKLILLLLAGSISLPRQVEAKGTLRTGTELMLLGIGGGVIASVADITVLGLHFAPGIRVGTSTSLELDMSPKFVFVPGHGDVAITMMVAPTVRYEGDAMYVAVAVPVMVIPIPWPYFEFSAGMKTEAGLYLGLQADLLFAGGYGAFVLGAQLGFSWEL